MDFQQIEYILGKGEGLTVEFKQSSTQLPNSLFETVSAFLNRNGGTILLGVSDSGEILGIDENKVEAMCKNLVNLSNNNAKLDPVFLLQASVVEIESKKIIYVFVPCSSQVHKTSGKIYDRSMDGDFVVTTHAKVSEMYTRKNTFYSENTIYPFLSEAHFEPETVQKAKNLIRANRPAHPWLELVGLDFFKSAGLYREDLNTGQSGFTLASLLLFGKEEAISSMLPHYKIEALVRKVDKERYDDRLSIRYNLMRAYESLMEFVAKHLPDKFYLEGDQRISLRENIFREVIANFLMHREYVNPRSATVEIKADSSIFKNANKPHLHGILEPANYESFPKNPHLAKFFVQIGRAEELGTGIRKIFKYSKLYSGEFPLVDENDIFTVHVPVLVTEEVENTTPITTPITTPKTTPITTPITTPKTTPIKTYKKLTNKELLIINILVENPRISISEIAEKLSISKEGIKYHINKLKGIERISREGSLKGGKWIVINSKKENR